MTISEIASLLVESERPGGEQLEEERLIGFLRTLWAYPPANFVDDLVQSVRQFSGVPPSEDDLAVIQFRFYGIALFARKKDSI